MSEDAVHAQPISARSSGEAEPQTESRSLLRLDGVRQSDMVTLSTWMNDLANLALWTSRRTPILHGDLHDFIRQRSRVGFFAIIRKVPGSEPIGFIDASFRERDVILELDVVYIRRESRLRSAGQAIVQFIGLAFTNYPIRKIVCQAYQYNANTRRLLERSGFVDEARLKDYVWWNDRYWDVHICSLDREHWEIGPLGRMWRAWVQRGRPQVETA